MKISTKLVTFYILSSLSIALFFSVSMYLASLKAIDRAVDSQMQDDMEAIVHLFSSNEQNLPSVKNRSLFQKYWLHISDTHGKELFISDIAREIKIPDKTLQDNTTVTIYTDFINFTGNKDVILRIRRYKTDTFSVAMGYPLDEDIANSYEKTVLTLVASIIIMCLFVYLLSKLLLRPLGDIANVLSTINEEKLHIRLRSYANDEIGILATSINALLAKLEHSFAGQRSFLSMISHELKTPLSIIKNHIEQALIHQNTALSFKQKFSNDLDQIAKLNEFIDRLLFLTRLEENSIRPNLQPFCLSKTVEAVCSLLEDIALSGNKRLICDIEDNIWFCADKALVYRAIVNLCDNALKYTPSKKTVKIRLIHLEGEACLTIDDEAGGIDKEILERVERKLPIVGFYGQPDMRTGIGLRLAVMLLKLNAVSYSFKKTQNGTTTTLLFPNVDTKLN